MPSDNRHSTLVAWAKVALPLAALALLSTVFLFGHKIEPGVDIPYADVDVEELARESRLTTPDYSGVTEDGASLQVRASSARPDLGQAGGASAERLVGKLVRPDGTVVDLTSAQGHFLTGNIDFEGNVAIQVSTGYKLLSDKIEMATNMTRIVSPGPVHGEGPLGTLEAGSMTITAPGPDAPHDLLFTGGVKIIYRTED